MGWVLSPACCFCCIFKLLLSALFYNIIIKGFRISQKTYPALNFNSCLLSLLGKHSPCWEDPQPTACGVQRKPTHWTSSIQALRADSPAPVVGQPVRTGEEWQELSPWRTSDKISPSIPRHEIKDSIIIPMKGFWREVRQNNSWSKHLQWKRGNQYQENGKAWGKERSEPCSYSHEHIFLLVGLTPLFQWAEWMEETEWTQAMKLGTQTEGNSTLHVFS